MDTTRFEDDLRRHGYHDVSLSGFPAGHDLGEHDHPYDVRGMVTEGEFVIGVDGNEVSHLPGDEFRLDRGTTHVERVGPTGVTFLIGRRHPAPAGDTT